MAELIWFPKICWISFHARIQDGVSLFLQWLHLVWVYTRVFSFIHTHAHTITHIFMNPHSSLGCLSLRSSLGAPGCHLHLVLVPFSLLHSVGNRRRSTTITIYVDNNPTTTHKNLDYYDWILIKINKWITVSVWRQTEMMAHLFVPLLMQVTQEDVCFLCYNNCKTNNVLIGISA